MLKTVRPIEICIFVIQRTQMKAFISILFVFLSFYSYSQSETIELLDFSTDSCDNTYTNPYKIKNRILNTNGSRDTLTYSIRISGNCCSKFTGAIEFSDTALNFIYLEENDICACHCGFTLFYKV